MSYLEPRTYNINLSSVGDYKQFDSRWGSDYTSCGNTMHNEGCVITAFANILKFNGISDDPGEVQDKLSPSDCPFYWYDAGEDYNLSSELDWGGFDSVRKRMFHLIVNERIPFIVHAKNSPDQHAVTVSGFEGEVLIDSEYGVVESSIKPEMFIINDPGSSKRDNLKEMLDYYNSIPIEKIAIYR